MRLRPLLLVIALLTPASLALAQAGPALLLKPWNEADRFELRGDFMFQPRGHVRNTDAPDDDFRLFQYEAAGRFRPSVEDERRLSLGFDMAVLDIDADGDPLPFDEHLADQSASIGVGVGEIEDWQFAVIAGVGYDYAGDDDEFIEDDAFYPRADLIVSKRLDERSQLTFVLDYNRNRAIFPDVPLPAVSYARRHSDELSFVVGLPLSSVTWKPVDRLTIDVFYSVPYTFDASITYDLTQRVSVFGAFDNRFYSFILDWHDDRIFFEQRRVEAGVRWRVVRQLEIEIAGGYAFDQEFTTGWDARDLDNDVEVSDEPYARFALTARF